MMKYIEQLRTKPRAVRERHAFLWAAGFTLIVATVWFIGFRARVVAELQHNGTQPATAASGVFDSLQAAIKAHNPAPQPNATVPSTPASTSTINIDSILKSTHTPSTTTSYGQVIQIEAVGPTAKTATNTPSDQGGTHAPRATTAARYMVQ